MYKVFGIPQSRAFRVIWMLEEIEIEYEHFSLKPGSQEVKNLNRSGKVPVLMDGEEILSDSSAIISYLGDKHEQLCFPRGSIERARQDAMVFRIIDEVDMMLWGAARHSFILPEDMRVAAIKPSLKWEFQKNIDNIMIHDIIIHFMQQLDHRYNTNVQLVHKNHYQFVDAQIL